MKKWEKPKVQSLNHRETFLDPIPVDTPTLYSSCKPDVNNCEPIPLYQCPCCRSFISNYDDVKLHMQTCSLCKNQCS